MQYRRTSKSAQRALLLALTFIVCVGCIYAALTYARKLSYKLDYSVRLGAIPSHNIQVAGDYVIYYDGMKLNALDTNGNLKWAYNIGVGSDFRPSKTGIAAWSGNQLYCINDKGLVMYNSKQALPIISAEMGEFYTALLVGNEHNSTLVVLDHQSNPVDKIELPNQTVMEYGFFNNGEMLWVMSLDTQGTVPLSQVVTYKPGKMLTGKITDSEQILYKVLFQNNFIKAIGTSNIKTYDYKAKEDTTLRQLVYGWNLQAVYTQEDKLMMLYVPSSQADGVAKISDLRLLSSTTDARMHLPNECFIILPGINSFYAFDSQYVFLIRPGSSTPIPYVMPMSIDDVLGITTDNNAIVVSGDTVNLVRLP